MLQQQNRQELCVDVENNAVRDGKVSAKLV